MEKKKLFPSHFNQFLNINNPEAKPLQINEKLLNY
jgi:hypothetical protein